MNLYLQLHNQREMLLKFESITNKTLKRVLEHVLYLILLLVLIPGFLFFEICIVLPAVAEIWTINLIHIPMAFFFILNIVGNMIFGMLSDSSIQGKYLYNKTNEDWTLCTVCECLRPPRAWHCDICNTCILKRDHHCSYLSTCVGYFNYRYFIFFTIHIFMSMVYAFYFNVKFVATFMSWNHGLALVKFIFPILNFVVDFGVESLYIFLFVINIVTIIFTGFLIYYHFTNILKGQTTPERKHKSNEYNKGWKNNIVEVFGIKWYLTWVLPFIPSPLPGDGVQWHVQDKYE